MDLQIPHIYAVFSSLACPVLHRIAFPVVSEWCQMFVDYTSLVPLRSTDDSPRKTATVAEKVELRTRANTKESRLKGHDERRVNIACTKGRLPVRKRLPLPIGQIGICAQIRVPSPDVLSTSSVPPRCNARSRIERKPR
jgi:hypothetical protein